MATRPPQPPKPTKAELTLLERGLPTDRQMQDRLADAMLVWLSPLLDALRKRVIGMVGAEVVRGNIPMPALAKGLKDNLFEDEEWWRGVAGEWEDPVRQWVRQAFGQTAQYQSTRWYFYTDFRRINQVALDYTQNDYIPDMIRLDGSQSFIDATRQRVVESIDLWERGELPGGRGLRDLEDALGDIFSPVRARRIAVTEATRVYADASRAAWLRSYRDPEYTQAYGIVGQRWSTARDERVCPICAPLNGKVVLLDEEFPVPDGYEGEPPAHVNCVVGETQVFAPGIVAALRIPYCGPLVEITLAVGGRLTVSPNHEILTPRGLIAADKLRQGDDIVYCPQLQGKLTANPDNHGKPTSIAQIFDTLMKAPGMALTSMPVAPEYLHGDARYGQGYIDIVIPYGLLQNDLMALADKPFAQKPFGADDPCLVSLPRRSPLTAFLFRCGSATGRIVGGHSIAPVFLWGAMRNHEAIGNKGISWGDATFYQVPTDNPTTDPVGFGKSIFRFSRDIPSPQFGGVQVYGHDLSVGAHTDTVLLETANDDLLADPNLLADCLRDSAGLVSFDKVIDIQRYSWHGYLYDLQSLATLYIANGVITSNCRCVLIPTRTYNDAFRPAGAAKPSKADIDRVRAYTSIPEGY